MKKISRQEQKEKTRLALVEKTGELFAQNGIANTTTAEIAKSLNLSHGTIFLHFPTRENLIQTVVDRFGERLSAELGKRLTSTLNLKQMLQAHLNVLEDFENLYLRLITENSSLPPEIRGQIYAINSSLSYRLYRSARPQMETGEIKKINQISFFNTWVAIVHYHISNRDLFSEKLPLLKYKSGELIRLFSHLSKPKENHENKMLIL